MASKDEGSTEACSSLPEPYKSLADDAIEEARKIVALNRDESDKWGVSFSDIRLSKKSLKAVPDMIVRRKKREDRGGVTIYTSRSLPVGAKEACSIVSDASVQEQLEPGAKVKSIVEDLGEDKIVHVVNDAQGPVSSRQMVVLVHKRNTDETFVTLKMDVKNHSNDPDPKNAKAYRMQLIEVVFYAPEEDKETCRRDAVLFVNLNLSSFIESTVHSFICKSAVPKKLYKIGKIILSRNDGDRLSETDRDGGAVPPAKTDDADTKDESAPEKRGIEGFLVKVEPYVVIAIAAISLYRALRQGR